MLSVRLTLPLHPLWRQFLCHSHWLPRCQIWNRWGLRGWWASACAHASRWGRACLAVPHHPLMRCSWPCPLLHTVTWLLSTHQRLPTMQKCFENRDISSSLFLFLWWYYTCFWGDELGMWLFLTPLPVGKLHSVFKGCISEHPNSNKNQSNPVNYKVGMKKWTKQGAPQARVTKYRMRKRKTIRRTELEREEREQVMQQTQ